MATKRSWVNALDQCFDNFCSPCNKNGKHSEAVKFCADCQEYLCTTCVGDHNKFAALAGHTLLGSSMFGTSGTDAGDLPSVPTERCKVHTMKLVDMYCVDHDSVGCHVCFTINHRQCQDIHYVPEYIQTPPHAEHIRKINDEIKNAISRLEDLVKETQKAKVDNSRNKDTCLKEIKAFRAEINQTLDRLEQASIAEVDKKYHKLDKGFKEELTQVHEMLNRLTKCKTEMESSKKNVSQQFVTTKICEKIISETEKYTTDSRHAEGDSLTFVRNSEPLSSLRKLDFLGHLQGPQKRSLYKIKGKKTYTVKLKGDRNDCKIVSTCILDSGDILLADWNNKTIKLVECKTYSIGVSMAVPKEPKSVCRVSSSEAAVTFGTNTVQFVSTKDELVPTHFLQFNHSCRGIAVLGSQLVVCENGSKAYIYTMYGERLKTIEKDKSEKAIFSHIREISVSDDGKIIQVADRDKGVVIIDIDGNVIHKDLDPVLRDACGVCTDGSGNVFVCVKTSPEVVQIRSDGQNMGKVIPASYALHPQAVSFDRRNSKLIVSSRNELQVFHVQ